MKGTSFTVMSSPIPYTKYYLVDLGLLVRVALIENILTPIYSLCMRVMANLKKKTRLNQENDVVLS